MILTGETGVLGEKPVTVPLGQPQIAHGLTCDRTRASAVTAPRHVSLTAVTQVSSHTTKQRNKNIPYWRKDSLQDIRRHAVLYTWFPSFPLS
jgi:hypothetical protein